MENKSLILTSDLAVLGDHDEILEKAAEWFGFDVANGDARKDTIDSYMSGVKHWIRWCQMSHVDHGNPTTEHIKAFRRELVDNNAAAATISSKLTAVRRFYEGALLRGFIGSNPAKGVRAPKNRSASNEVIEHLSDNEANHLFKTIPQDGRLKSLRDRTLIALMTIEGLRRVEIHRANLEDISYEAGRMRLLVHGKGKDRFNYPRQSDVVGLIEKYIERRGPVKSDKQGQPLFVEITRHNTPLGRLSRRGLTKIVSQYFLAAGITKPVSKEDKERVTKRQRNCHALRHTCGTDLYRETKDLKLVQEALGHSTIEMAAKYSHVDRRAKSRVTEKIPIDIE